VQLVPLQEPPVNHSSNTPLWQELQLPPPLLQASLSAELADKLQLQRLRILQGQNQQQSVPHSTPLPESTAAPEGGSRAVTGQQSAQEVSVARLQALLTLQSGRWCLEAVPTGPRPEAVAAVLARQQQPQQELLWGTLDTTQLLADLQVTPCLGWGWCVCVWGGGGRGPWGELGSQHRVTGFTRHIQARCGGGGGGEVALPAP